MNSITLVGRLVRDLERKNASNGEYTTGCIAVKKDFVKPGQKDSTFFEFVAFRQSGDYLFNYGAKGRLIAIKGSHESNDYVDKDGNNRVGWSVRVEHASILDRPREETGQEHAGGGAPKQAAPESDDSQTWDPFAP